MVTRGPHAARIEEVYGSKRLEKDSFCSDPVSKAKVEFPDNLVGRAQINFDMYSGYVNISTAPDYLFYWFFSSQDGDASAPLIIWTNGKLFYQPILPGWDSIIIMFSIIIINYYY